MLPSIFHSSGLAKRAFHIEDLGSEAANHWQPWPSTFERIRKGDSEIPNQDKGEKQIFYLKSSLRELKSQVVFMIPPPVMDNQT